MLTAAGREGKLGAIGRFGIGGIEEGIDCETGLIRFSVCLATEEIDGECDTPFAASSEGEAGPPRPPLGGRGGAAGGPCGIVGAPELWRAVGLGNNLGGAAAAFARS